MIKRAIFDFDGTIADSKSIGIKILNDLAPKYGYKQLPETLFHECADMGLKKRMETLGISYKKLVPISRDFIKEFKRHAAVVEPVVGMVEAIKHIHSRGIGITIISSNAKENIDLFIKNNGLCFIDRVRGIGKLFGKEKYIRRELRQLGLLPEEAIYIGDEVRDIEACKKAGIRVIAVTWGFDSPALLETAAPDYMAASLEEMLERMV